MLTKTGFALIAALALTSASAAFPGNDGQNVVAPTNVRYLAPGRQGCEQRSRRESVITHGVECRAHVAAASNLSS